MPANDAQAPESSVETEIAEGIKAAKLRLRSDKVVQRLTRILRARLAGAATEGRSVAIAITAPIKHPGKTAEALEALVRGAGFENDGRSVIWGNEVRVRDVAHNTADAPKVLVFVHNPDSDSGRILDIAVSRLLQPAGRDE